MMDQQFKMAISRMFRVEVQLYSDPESGYCVLSWPLEYDATDLYDSINLHANHCGYELISIILEGDTNNAILSPIKQ